MFELGPVAPREVGARRLDLPGKPRASAAAERDSRRLQIHGDLALDNVLIDERGELSFIDWADGGSGDPRHDVALALDMKPDLELSRQALDTFFSGYGSAALDEQTRDWFVRLYDFF